MSERVEIHQEFRKPIAKVFADIADHETFGAILGAPITRIADGKGAGGVNGLGSIRRIGPKGLGFEETIVAFEPNALIEYRITKGGPLRNHLGRMVFTETASGCRLDYVITFEGKLPFVGGVVRRVLQTAASRSLAAYASR